MNDLAGFVNERIEALRPKLQDTSRRNPLINNVLTARSASFIRIVDEKPQSIFDDINGLKSSMLLDPLPPLDIDPPDEDSTEFKNAFQSAQATHDEYLIAIEEIDFEYDELAEDKREHAERSLKDRVREMLDMPPRPKSEQLTDLKNHAKSHGINPSSTLPEPDAKSSDDRFEDEFLQTLLFPKTFQSRMSRILSKARMYQEERGLEVVYLVLGYLKWTLPNAEKNDEFKSPLLLLPVTLSKSKSSAGETYSITKRGDAVFNPSLAHKLTVEAQLDLSAISSYMESSEIEVEELFHKVRDLSPRNMRWDVMREAAFGVYPFQGIELFYDLDSKDCDFSSFPIISELMVGSNGTATGEGSFSEADVESKVGQQLVPHLVLDADSSQFIALLKVANEQNVALEGPPGSGKSQTIVNAIANAIHAGKRVLFVAQKVTALEVVFSRLQALGLDHFVLPLMGGRGNTDDFYKAVEQRLSLSTNQSSRDLSTLENKLSLQRDRLASYIDVLTKPVINTSLSVHQVLGLAIANNGGISLLPVELQAAPIYPKRYSETFSIKDIESVAEQVGDWCRRLKDAAISENSVWYGVDALRIDTGQINSALVSAKRAILSFENSSKKLEQSSLGLLDTCLSKSYSCLQSDRGEIESNETLKLVHGLVSQYGNTDVDRVINGVFSANSERESLEAEHNLSHEQLSQLMMKTGVIERMLEFCQVHQIDKIRRGFIQQFADKAKGEAERLQFLLDYENQFVTRSGDKIRLDIVTKFSSIKSIQGDIASFSEYLRKTGLDRSIGELKAAVAIHRSASKLLTTDELPEIATLKQLKDTIQNAGIFSFLSSNVKNAKKKVQSLLSSVNQDSSKQLMISALDEVLQLAKEWQMLRASEYIVCLDKSSANELENLAMSVEELSSKAASVSLSERDSIDLVCKKELNSIGDSLVRLDDELKSWTQIKDSLDKATAIILRIDSEADELKEAERFLLDINKEWVIDLGSLISASLSAKEIEKQIDSLLRRIDSSITFGEIDKVKLAYDKYCSLSSSDIALHFEGVGHEANAFIVANMESISTIYQSAISLQKAKFGVNVENLELSVNDAKAMLQAHISDSSGLNGLISRRAVFTDAENLGFNHLLRVVENQVDVENVSEIALAAIVSSLKDQVERDYGALLLAFDGTSLSSARSELQKLDRKIIEISPNQVRLNGIGKADPPVGVSYGRKSEYTDLSLLNHELQKQRRTVPRKILKRAQGALLELFPCWMMVPTAVAQHLPRNGMFDLVIIDEASQMTPENSISALMRGKNALIAGDTNQLPPTNFFKGLAVDEEEDEDLTTTEESILELANIQFQPKHRLLWHYRSKHEDLIAFSNHYVYDSELVIFPSPTPASRGLGISLVQVNGTFQRGINPAEAQVMLEAIVQFMEETPERSLGVAVMNQSQMEQIDALVLRESETNRKVSDYLDRWASEKEGLEKFFVKNLENVQGDERDVIFVGTVYGRDPQGKFYQRFGPINGPAGKRRLNVLFSRAKEQIVTFSSIPMSDFNPSITNEGAILLRRWLEFSATKKLGEVAHAHDRMGHTDSPFEDHVIEAIKSLGYEAVPQVGVSSYFIDIGVKHSSYPYGYICGVECDGASYHSSKSARDRDRLREEVLNRLGWDLYRIWSTDWFRDALGCRAVLKQYLDARLKHLLSTMPEPVVDQVVEVEDDNSSKEDRNGDSQIASASQDNVDPDECVIDLGTKFAIRYLDGPRAGVAVKFLYHTKTQDKNYSMEGYTTIGPDSPLGEALEGAELGDICSYNHGSNTVRVEITEMEK